MIRLTAATVAVLLGILWIVFLRPTFLGGSTSYVMVSGTSMQPTYFTGDLVLTRKQSGYAKGDIVAYHVPQGQPGAGNVVIHRVVGGNATDGYEMRGDNRNADDSWHPKPADAVGRAWLHIPQAGKWLAYFQRPLPFGLLIGFIGAGGFIGKSKVRRRRRNGRLKDMGKQNGTGGGLPAPAWLIDIFGALCLIVVGSAFVGARAFRTDTHKTQTVERLSYDETAAYDYTAHVTPSSLYPTGVIGPVTADGAATIFSPETPTLDLGVKYALKPTNSPPALDFKGEISAVAKISSGESGWSKTINVLPATPFSGMSTEVQLPIDLPQIQALIKTIETETDFAASSYSVVVTPKVHIAGRLGSNAVDETFAPPFTITLSKSEVTLDPSLSRSEPKKQEDKISASQKLSIVGIESSVTQA